MQDDLVDNLGEEGEVSTGQVFATVVMSYSYIL